MYAPKPAICGNGHAAMQRTQTAVIHSTNTAEKPSQNKEAKKDLKRKAK